MQLNEKGLIIKHKLKRHDMITITPPNDLNTVDLSISEFVGREERNLLLDDISTKTINTNSIDHEEEYMDLN